ncbi:transposase [Streptomyces sp. NPDC056713]|uniref:transposase n=1 Tax=Streptomyces sp. NPDC056713 TaxID=3345921 RepID=UPI0036953BD8
MGWQGRVTHAPQSTQPRPCARRLRQELPGHIRKYLWGDHFWSPSYSAASCGGRCMHVPHGDGPGRRGPPMCRRSVPAGGSWGSRRGSNGPCRTSRRPSRRDAWKPGARQRVGAEGALVKREGPEAFLAHSAVTAWGASRSRPLR